MNMRFDFLHNTSHWLSLNYIVFQLENIILGKKKSDFILLKNC